MTQEERNAKARETYLRLRKMVLIFYAGDPPKCACCHENRQHFLVIDHKEGGGNIHRKEMSGLGRMYRWIIKNNFPPIFNVLCYNCNAAKQYHGKCH